MNINIKSLINHHNKNKRLATITAVKPPGRFGAIKLVGSIVNNFQEKPDGDNSWINGGFFVLKPGVFKYLKDETTVWEQDPLFNLSKNKELSFYKHFGFWQPMDTLRDKNFLESLWLKGKAPWKVW